MSETQPARIDPSVWKTAIVVVIAPFMAQMDSSVVNVSLSSIGHALDAPIATAQWIVSGYLLAMALTLPLNGWLVDRIGAKRLYVMLFALFTLASVLCGVSRTMGELIAARIFQGLAGGVLAPMAQMMIARAAGQNMARVMGYTTVPILLAPIVGPLVAGAILAHAEWPWLFWLNVPVGLLGVALAVRLLPRDAGSTERRPFDLVGFALISPGLVALIDGLQQAAHGDGRWTLLAGAALLAAFVLHARRKGGHALIDLGLFADRTFSVAAITQFFANGIMYGRQLVVPVYLIVGCGLSAAQAGGFLAATGLGMMCSFPLLGRLTERYGCRAVAAGGALLAVLGTLPFLWLAGHAFSAAWAAASLFIAGAGQGTISIPSISAAYASMPKARIAVANTALNISQRVGGPLATTLLAAAISLTVHGSSSAQFLLPFVALCALHLLAFGAALCLPLRIHRTN